MSGMEKAIRMLKKIKWWDLILLAIVVYVLAGKVPMWIAQWKAEGQVVQPGALEDLAGASVAYPSPSSGATVAVFWATWCGPCSVELDRLKKAVDAGELDPKKIVTISVGEEPALVRRTVQERGYPFVNLLDRTGALAQAFKVEATPTVAFLDGTKVTWLTAGLSPTLVYRAQRHLAPE